MSPIQDQIEDINSTMLSNGMTRGEYLAELNRLYSQPPVDYSHVGARRWHNVPYGTQSERQCVDIYLPEGQGPFPVLFWVHGGAWFMGSRADFGVGIAMKFLPYGYAVVSVGYRLADEAVFPQPVRDVMQAVQFVADHAVEYDLDGARMGISSGSAGAIVAALCGLWRNDIRAVVLRCPILDFTRIREQYKAIGMERGRFAYPDEDTSIEALFLGGPVQALPLVCENANPAEHLNGRIPHFMLLHGLMDTDTPYLQSVGFAEAVWKKHGKEYVQLKLLPDTGHDNGLYDEPKTFKKQLQFIHKYL